MTEKEQILEEELETEEGITDEDIEEEKEDKPLEESEEETEEEPKEEYDVEASLKEKLRDKNKKISYLYSSYQKLAAENESLKQTRANQYHDHVVLSAKGVTDAYNNALEMKKAALLGDDLDARIEADERYTKALYDKENFVSWYNSEYKPYLESLQNQDVEKEEEEDDTDYEKQALAQEWLTQHPELTKGSRYYNPRITKEVESFIDKVNNTLVEEGATDLIYTEKYFDALDQFIKQAKPKTTKNIFSSLNTGGVKGGNYNSNDMRLSKEEESFAEVLGDKKTYAKYHLEYLKHMKEQKNRMV